MASPTEKIKNVTPPAPKPVPYDPDRLHMSRDEVMKKDRLRAEIEAKLELERVRLEAEYEKEQEALENLGKEELESSMKKSDSKKSAKKAVEEE